MHATFFPVEEAGSVVDHSNVLKRFSSEGCDVNIAEYQGRDILWLQTLAGTIIVIEADDRAYGGSSHDHARAARNAGLL